MRTYLTSPPCALDSSGARQRIGSMGLPPLRFRPALSRSIEVSLSYPHHRRLVGCYPAVEARGCRSHKMVMAQGLPARVGENVSDEWLCTCQGTWRGTIPLHLSRQKWGFVRVFCKKIFRAGDTSHVVGIEVGQKFTCFQLFFM